MAGVGDLLALFRCISCRYCFGTDGTAPAMLGAPGRVFTTSEVSGQMITVELKGFACMDRSGGEVMGNCSHQSCMQ